MTDVSCDHLMLMTLIIIDFNCNWFSDSYCNRRPEVTWLEMIWKCLAWTQWIARTRWKQCWSVIACSHRRHGQDKTVSSCLVLSVTAVWTSYKGSDGGLLRWCSVVGECLAVLAYRGVRGKVSWKCCVCACMWWQWREMITLMIKESKGKEKYLYSASLVSLSKRSDVDHTVLPVNYTMSAFPS